MHSLGKSTSCRLFDTVDEGVWRGGMGGFFLSMRRNDEPIRMGGMGAVSRGWNDFWSIICEIDKFFVRPLQARAFGLLLG